MSSKLNSGKKGKTGRSSIGGKGADIFFGKTEEHVEKDKIIPGKENFASDISERQQVIKETSKQKTRNNNLTKSTYSEEQYERVTYYLPRDLKKKIKVEATIRDVKVSEFVIELLERQLKQVG